MKVTKEDKHNNTMQIPQNPEISFSRENSNRYFYEASSKPNQKTSPNSNAKKLIYKIVETQPSSQTKTKNNDDSACYDQDLFPTKTHNTSVFEIGHQPDDVLHKDDLYGCSPKSNQYNSKDSDASDLSLDKSEVDKYEVLNKQVTKLSKSAAKICHKYKNATSELLETKQKIIDKTV